MALDGYVQTKWFSPRLMVILGMMIMSSPIVGILVGIAFGSTHSGHIPWYPYDVRGENSCQAI